MQDSSLLSWLAQTTRGKQILVLILSVFLGILVIGIPFSVFAYVHIGFSRQLTALLISALGAFSTVLLVGVTFATFIENQMRKEKENQRELVAAELREVIQPSRTRLEANVTTVTETIVRWHRFDSEQWQEDGQPGFKLERLCEHPSDDGMVFNRFFDREPAIEEQFEEHDERVVDLAVKGAELVETFTEPIGMYLEQENLYYKYDDPPRPKNIALYVLSDVNELPDLNADQEFWTEHQDDLRMLANDIAPDELEAFRRAKRDYLEFVGSLKGELRGTRRQLERTYSISLNENRADEKQETTTDVNSGYSAT